MALAAGVAHAGDGHFSASDVPAATLLHKGGHVVISNDSKHITAYRFANNIREALVSLQSSRSLRYDPRFRASLYQSDARVNSPIPEYLSLAIAEAAKKHGVDPRLIAAVATRESRFNAAAISPVGACGIMQLMPATAKWLGLTNVFDARENVFAGARYLRTILDTFHGDLDLTLAAYNAGPGAVQRYNGIPPFHETQAYVTAVRASYERSLRSN